MIAITHIQNTEPNPPIQIADETPTIFPVSGLLPVYANFILLAPIQNISPLFKMQHNGCPIKVKLFLPLLMKRPVPMMTLTKKAILILRWKKTAILAAMPLFT